VGTGPKKLVKKSSGWIARKVFGKLDKTIQQKMKTAMKKGIVAPVGKSGVIKLSASELKKYPGYTHKLKIKGKGASHFRVYGTQGKNGHFFFDLIKNTKK